MDSTARYSIHVSRTLNCMGYSKAMIKYRVQNYKEVSEVFISGMKCLYVGSKGEGLSAPMQSDLDMMLVYEDVLCSANPKPRDTVFEMETRDSPPGYTKLKLYRVFKNDVIKDALIHFYERGIYISSEIFLKYNLLPEVLQCFQHFINTLSIDVTLTSSNGPAATSIMCVFGSKLCNDIVLSFPCTHFSWLDNWKNRRRDYNWPPFELIMNINNTDIGYVVPVGPKGSDNQHLEWRICFTTIEQKLIHLLNDTQTKLYLLLKMVVKNVVQPNFEDITSYVMKNIVLWMAELVPEEQFKENLLIDRLMQALYFLKYCVKTNCLPSYILPERNLLARKMICSQRLKLEDTLSEIISYGGGILMRCKQFKKFTVCMYKEPDLTLRFALKREMIERLWLLQYKTMDSLCFESFVNDIDTDITQVRDILRNNQIFQIINTILFELVIPEWRTFMVVQGIDEYTIRCYFHHALRNYLL